MTLERENKAPECQVAEHRVYRGRNRDRTGRNRAKVFERSKMRLFFGAGCASYSMGHYINLEKFVFRKKRDYGMFENSHKLIASPWLQQHRRRQNNVSNFRYKSNFPPQNTFLDWNFPTKK